MIVIRWVTWWPAPYWTDRFNYLAKCKDVDLEVCFLSEGSSIQYWASDAESWQFRHAFISRKSENSGYFKVQLKFPNSLPLLKGYWDIIIMNYADVRCILAAFICLITKKDYFLFSPNTNVDIRSGHWLKEHLKRFLFSHAAGVLATGPAQKEYTLRYVDDAQKVHVIGNPSQLPHNLIEESLKRRVEMRMKQGWKSRVVIIYVGRLSKEKGLLTLFKALDIGYQKGIQPVLVLVGSGEMEETLREDAKRRGIEVIFTGFLHGKKLLDYYAMADIFVLPSVSEPWGLVVNEAMEFGMPIVLSRNVGASQALLREGKNGFSFAVGDADALSDHIELLYTNEALRLEMGEISKRIIRKHSVKHWADAVVKAVHNNLN